MKDWPFKNANIGGHEELLPNRPKHYEYVKERNIYSTSFKYHNMMCLSTKKITFLSHS